MAVGRITQLNDKPVERDRVILADLKFAPLRAASLYAMKRAMHMVYTATCTACVWAGPEEPSIERAFLDLVGHCSMKGHTPPPVSWHEFE